MTKSLWGQYSRLGVSEGKGGGTTEKMSLHAMVDAVDTDVQHSSPKLLQELLHKMLSLGLTGRPKERGRNFLYAFRVTTAWSSPHSHPEMTPLRFTECRTRPTWKSLTDKGTREDVHSSFNWFIIWFYCSVLEYFVFLYSVFALCAVLCVIKN